MNRLEQLLDDHRVILLDGGWGFQLLDVDCPERCNLEQPERILAIAKSYVDAGSMIIGTNSFGGRWIRKAVELSKQAAGDRCLVSGTIGPGGSEQATILSECGVDLITIETMLDPVEALTTVRACKSVTNLPIVCTFSPLDGDCGQLLRGCEAVLKEDCFAVGVNCGNGPDDLLRYVEPLVKAFPAVPIVFKPSAGLPTNNVYPFSTGQFCGVIEKALDMGARMVGGCCGTDAETIRALKRRIDERR